MEKYTMDLEIPRGKNDINKVANAYARCLIKQAKRKQHLKGKGAR